MEKALGENEEELNNAVKTRQSKTVEHTETLAKIADTRAALNESNLKCAALEEALQRQLQEKEESYRREEKEREESVKREKKEEFQRKLQEKQNKFNQNLQIKEETMRQELRLLEEKFEKEHKEMQKQYETKISEREEWMKEKLLHFEESVNEQLSKTFQQWMSRAEHWGLRQKELEIQLQESTRRRQQEEERRRDDIQRLSAEIFHLQVTYLYSSFRRFQMIFREI